MADPSERAALEAELRRLFDAGKADAVITMTLEKYGPELLGLLRSMTRNEAEADDAWGTLALDMVRGIRQFAWRSTLRTWAFALARNAALRVRSAPAGRAARNVALSESAISALAAHVRTQTRPYLRTEIKNAVAELRSALDPDDQLLLVLRVDEGLSWENVADIMEGSSEDKAIKKRRAARLRQRFQTVKDTLRREAEVRGLLGESG